MASCAIWIKHEPVHDFYEIQLILRSNKSEPRFFYAEFKLDPVQTSLHELICIGYMIYKITSRRSIKFLFSEIFI